MSEQPMSDERLAEIRAHFDVLDNLTLDEDDPGADQRIGTYIYYKQGHYHEVLDAVMAREDDGPDLLTDNDRLRAELAEAREREIADGDELSVLRATVAAWKQHDAAALEIVRAVAEASAGWWGTIELSAQHPALFSATHDFGAIREQARALLARDTPVEGGA